MDSVLRDAQRVTVNGRLFRICPYCEQGTRYTSRYGGNDPDTWPVGRCKTCEGTSLVPIMCDGWRCEEPATAEFDGDFCCARHLAEWMADADEGTTS